MWTSPGVATTTQLWHSPLVARCVRSYTRFPGPSVVRSILSNIKGFNWVLIDGEHGQISDGDFYEVSTDEREAM